ncbi:UTP--glucose-1-phosphate uridylyltransferase [Patescibacteria group bacterium]|nr:UTP--glucose-1-phosphate uridylyltransferase [Patescibacteria group bacterium]
MKIRKLVIPAAGYGTRFLPFTKSIPKEMLPVVDRPVIQYIVEEAVEAGIEQIILITGYSKRAIEDYFDYNLELEYLLERSGKLAQRQMIRDLSDVAHFVYIRQKEQLGNGHAILQARDVVGDEPFAVMWGDEVYKGKPSKLQQMIDAYEKYKAPILFAMQRTGEGDYDKYGYAKISKDMGDGVFKVEQVIEKPGKEYAPSPYATISASIVTPDIFPILENQKPGKGGEIYLADAVNALAQKKPVYIKEGKKLKYFDCGNKLEYLKAVVEFALERQDLGEDFRNYLQTIV